MALSANELDWLSRSVVLVQRPDLRAELERRRPSLVRPAPVSVTDLVDPRYAYWRRAHPLPPSPERAERMERGRSLHELVGRAVASPLHVEVRVERDGIVGRIDLFDDLPTEIKTAAHPLGPEVIRTERPQHLEQLGMYCALVDRSEGRLLLLTPGEGAPPVLRALVVRYRSLDAFRQEMRMRADSLREARTRGSPRELSRCSWYGRGCEFAEAGICGCTGTEPGPDARLLDLTDGPVSDPISTARLSTLLTEGLCRGVVSPATRFRDLLYPRRAYFEKTAPQLAEAEASESTPERTSAVERRRELVDAMRAGPSGETTRRSPLPEFPPEMVDCFRDAPVLVRTSRSRWVPRPDRFVREQPQYFLDLGFKAAAIDRKRAYLILDYDRADRPQDRLQTWEVRFDDVGPLGDWARDRSASLARAVARGEPNGLPPCPAWMFETCPYRARCQCGAPALLRG